MSQYYFLASVLPDLKIGDIPDISFYDLKELMRVNLSADDLAKIQVIRRYYDIENIRSFWNGDAELDRYGNLNWMELEEALLTHSGLPKYVYDFMEKYDHLRSRLDHFSELVSIFFSKEIAKADGFLKEYLQFERNWRLILVAFRAKKLGRDIAFELQNENPEDPWIAQILAFKDAKTYEPPEGYEELKPLFQAYQDDPIALHKALCEYRFAKIESMMGIDFFSIGRVLGFFAQLILVEKWLD